MPLAKAETFGGKAFAPFPDVAWQTASGVYRTLALHRKRLLRLSAFARQAPAFCFRDAQTE